MATRPDTVLAGTAPPDTGSTDTVPAAAARSDTAAWLDDREQAAWRAYIETVGDLMAALEADLLPTGLNLGDYQVLVYLSEADERSMRMCDLAESLQLSPSGLTRRLDGLVRAGLVSREGSPADRRVMLAVLTDEGLDTLRAAAPIHVDSVRRRVFDHLDHDEVDALHTIFRAIGAHL
ncbi:MAG: MarR family transcriptional regulator [Ilumatobacteraceae bacterium]